MGTSFFMPAHGKEVPAYGCISRGENEGLHGYGESSFEKPGFNA